jgi:bilirubin oxidase
MQLKWCSRGFGATASLALALSAGTLAEAQEPLDPTEIPKYVRPLVIPPPMPKTDTIAGKHGAIDYYEIGVRQFEQEVLPPSFPATTVWSYGSVNHPGTFNYPAFTVEARVGRPVRVKWVNQLVDENGEFLPHLLPVDPTLHWANPPGGEAGRDSHPTFTETPGPYTGPIPIVTHLHGGLNAQESDGFAEAWYLPAARNIPAGFATEGTWYEFMKNEFRKKFGVVWEPGTATFQYENKEPPSTDWYHDHTLGMTRANVYAGPAGFYLLRAGDKKSACHEDEEGRDDHDGKRKGDSKEKEKDCDELEKAAKVESQLPGPAPRMTADPSQRVHEIPIAVQDRSFNSDGSLFYPASRTFFDGITEFTPDTDVPPIWNPEFFGNTIVVNGRTWPFLEVEPRRYRFRFLNGSNSRFLILKMVTDPLAERPAVAALPFWQIGAEGGFLPEPVRLDQLLMGNAERADTIVDFTGLPSGTEIFLINEGPDEPFGLIQDVVPADPATTGQVMKFVVVPLEGKDKSRPPEKLKLPKPERLGKEQLVRKVSLNEETSAFFPDAPIAAKLGTLNGAGEPVPLNWDVPITEHPALHATEIWEIHNFTADAHPIHLHELHFEVVNREVMIGGEVSGPRPWETGLKDTVIAPPGEITRIKARFDEPGLFVWHCHIVEHEDNEMMRPLFVGPNPPDLDNPPTSSPKPPHLTKRE